MQRLRDDLTLISHLGYLWWCARGRRDELRVQLATGHTLLLRPPPAHDLEIAYEIFTADVYDCPREIDARSIRHIVDVGANVGFSCLNWLRTYPDAHITAFEPHPAHVRQIRRHLQVNGLEEQVTLIAAAAGRVSGEMFLTDAGPESQLHTAAQPDALQVPVVDWFETIGSEAIDLLKLDIEGGEYTLLADARFAALRCRVAVLEWHRSPEISDGAAWCAERFERLGYRVLPGKLVTERAGLLWAFHD